MFVDLFLAKKLKKRPKIPDFSSDLSKYFAKFSAMEMCENKMMEIIHCVVLTALPHIHVRPSMDVLNDLFLQCINFCNKARILILLEMLNINPQIFCCPLLHHQFLWGWGHSLLYPPQLLMHNKWSKHEPQMVFLCRETKIWSITRFHPLERESESEMSQVKSDT